MTINGNDMILIAIALDRAVLEGIICEPNA